MNQLQSWWKGLSRRDQRLFSVWLAGMAAAALVWCGATLMAAQERVQSQLAAEWQILNAMRVQADEAQRLKQLPTVGSKDRYVDEPAVSDSLPKHGLSAEILQPSGSGDLVVLQGMVPFDKWVAWLAFVQKDMRLVVQQAKATRVDDLPGIAEIQATLELGKD